MAIYDEEVSRVYEEILTLHGSGCMAVPYESGYMDRSHKEVDKLRMEYFKKSALK